MVNKIRSAKIIQGNNSVYSAQRKYLKDALRVVAKKDISVDEPITPIKFLINVQVL